MNILIDTNIFIPLESKSIIKIEPDTHLINEFYRKAKQLEYHIFLLDSQIQDIQRDENIQRKFSNTLAFEKYELLAGVKITDEIKTAFFPIQQDNHDYVDVLLLNALLSNAVSILVTNDEGIHRKAKKIGLEDKVYDIEEALNFVNAHTTHTLKTIHDHPLIESEKCFNLNIKDSFFDSLRSDYEGFDKWFKEKCQNGHRDCLVIRNLNKIEGLCIYKFEEPVYEMSGSILKICTFKLCSHGKKLGELLLKTLFQYSYNSNVDYLYVTAFENNYICTFFENFGFRKYSKRKEDTGELIYIKRMKPGNVLISDSLNYNIFYGTKYFDTTRDAFLVPIISTFHSMLFPELCPTLFPELDYANSFSNAIRKAYISKSNTTLINPGDILFFYKTHAEGTVRACGIVEKICRSKNADEILSITGKRTIYKRTEIEKMCLNGKTPLILLFRQVESLVNDVKLGELVKMKIINGFPQTITKLNEKAKKCILEKKPF